MSAFGSVWGRSWGGPEYIQTSGIVINGTYVPVTTMELQDILVPRTFIDIPLLLEPAKNVHRDDSATLVPKPKIRK